jgi:hypothetical protein
VISLPKGRKRLPDKKEEQGSILSRLNDLAPLLNLIIRILELILKIFRVIK